MKNGDSHLVHNDRLPHYIWMGKSEALSMVAHVPDSKCMWFDKSGRYCFILVMSVIIIDLGKAKSKALLESCTPEPKIQ